MPVVPTQEILKRAFADRYGVAAINVVNELTMEAVLAAAEELQTRVDKRPTPLGLSTAGLRAETFHASGLRTIPFAAIDKCRLVPKIEWRKSK